MVTLKTQPDSDTNDPAAFYNVSRWFWGLLLSVLFIAIGFSGFAVRQTATPFLEDQQKGRITEQALKDVRNIEALLAKHRFYLNFVASHPEVISAVLGHSEHTDAVERVFASSHRPEALADLRLYDVFGQMLVEMGHEPGARHLHPERKYTELARAFDVDAEGAKRQVLLLQEEERTRIILAVGVYNDSYLEGVLFGEFDLDLVEVFSDNEISEYSEIVRTDGNGATLGTLPQTAVVFPLKDVNLALVQVPDLEAVTRAGNRLLQSVVGAVALVLLAAFGLFAWLGRAAIVEPHRQLAAQRTALMELAAISELAEDAILVTDLHHRVVWANPAFQSLTGHSFDDIKGVPIPSILRGPDTDKATAEKLDKALAERRHVKLEMMDYRKNGETYWSSKSISPLTRNDGDVYGFVSISNDITETREQREAVLAAQRETELQALHDPLTGLPNRRALDLALAERNKSGCDATTIVRIDLDHFKYVNDTMGHAAGDHVLCQVADILRDETKADDVPARVGGDEFLILLAAGMDSTAGEAVANRMLNRIQSPKTYQGKPLRVGASFGVASTVEQLLSIDQLIVGADAALYEAKSLGRSTVRLYTPDLHRSVLDRRALAREIRRGISSEQFEPHFQPQIDAATRDIVGVETLARWHSPELGMLSPAAFMPIAEQLSVVDEIDLIIFRKAMEQILKLRSRGVIVPKVSFNVTAARIQDSDSFDVLRPFLGCGPKISFEILESVLVEEQSNLFAFSLDRLRDAGVLIEVDDFGSGHASIIGLMQLRPDIMKIDQRLIRPITTDPLARGILKQIFGMADLAGFKVTAEGVETDEHAEILTELGCDVLQGYAFSMPLQIDALHAFILRHRKTVGLAS